MERMIAASFWSVVPNQRWGQKTWWHPVSCVLCVSWGIWLQHWGVDWNLDRPWEHTCLHAAEGIGVLTVCEWPETGFTFKQGWALRIARFLLQCYNSSSCKGGGQLLLVSWLILGDHTGYGEYLGSLSNSVSRLSSWLVTVHLKGCLFTLFWKGFVRFSCSIVNHFKGVMKSSVSTHQHRKKETILFS